MLIVQVIGRLAPVKLAMVHRQQPWWVLQGGQEAVVEQSVVGAHGAIVVAHLGAWMALWHVKGGGHGWSWVVTGGHGGSWY